jgi:hypothetical protein
VLLSDIGRAIAPKQDLRDTTREWSEQLINNEALDTLPNAWLRFVAPLADTMPFIAVDGTDLSKPHGKDFEFLDFVRDGSAPGKPTRPGYWAINIEATNGHHTDLPLHMSVFSTKDPQFAGWTETFQSAISTVKAVTGAHATWLFDRGFDDNKFIKFIVALTLTWVIRIKKNRNVIVGDERKPITQNIKFFARNLAKPHTVMTPYVDKSSHKVKCFPLRFGFAPVRLSDVEGTYWLVVVTGTRNEDWLLLSNKPIRSVKDAKKIVLAYIERWGNEEVTRFWKQSTGAENFRVRKLCSIRRLLFLSMLATAIQAYWLLTRPSTVQKVIALVQAYIEKVPFMHYRLFDGVSLALQRGS